jgi:hypothetical protein
LYITLAASLRQTLGTQTLLWRSRVARDRYETLAESHTPGHFRRNRASKEENFGTNVARGGQIPGAGSEKVKKLATKMGLSARSRPLMSV